jgi:epoxyqueuosine reductase
MTADTLTAALKAEAQRLGFHLAGACPAISPPGVDHLAVWLERGYAGEMDYIQRRAEAYRHPSHVLDGARSVLMLSMNYRSATPVEPAVGQGRVSRYAWGVDYHELIRERLNRLADFLMAQRPGALARGVVDSAPLLEREFAQLSGLGWIGKNTLLINKRSGSYFFLAALLTDQELTYDAPHGADHCGTCMACLDACPTNAFVEPGVLDARRCISYLTIELRGPIPTELRSGVGDWLFGCDVCQDVCPWNHKAPLTDEPDFEPLPDSNPIDLAPLFSFDDEAFRRRFRHSPLWRAKRRGLLRNAAIVLGNQRASTALKTLERGLADPEPLVRAACVWAIEQIGEPESRDRLSARMDEETDDEVRTALSQAIQTLSTRGVDPGSP